MKKQSVYKQTEWELQAAKNTIKQKAHKKIENKNVWRIRLFILLSSALGGSAIVTHYENTQINNQLTAIKSQQTTTAPKLTPARYSPYQLIDGSEDCIGLIQSIGDVTFCQLI